MAASGGDRLLDIEGSGRLSESAVNYAARDRGWWSGLYRGAMLARRAAPFVRSRARRGMGGIRPGVIAPDPTNFCGKSYVTIFLRRMSSMLFGQRETRMPQDNEENIPGLLIFDKYKPLIYSFILVFSVFIGGLYQWGYWGYFYVNIFQYISLSEILMDSIIPLGTVSISCLVVLVLRSSPKLPTGRVLPAGGGRNTRVGVWLNKIKILLLLLYLSLCGATLVFLDQPYNIAMFLILVGMPIPFILSETGLGKNVIKNDFLRDSVIIYVVTITSISYGDGAMNAASIIKGDAYSEARVNDETVTFKFLGQIAGSVFLLKEDNKTVEVRGASDIHKLDLTPMTHGHPVK